MMPYPEELLDFCQWICKRGRFVLDKLLEQNAQGAQSNQVAETTEENDWEAVSPETK
jgi:hypothetical protein